MPALRGDPFLRTDSRRGKHRSTVRLHGEQLARGIHSAGIGVVPGHGSEPMPLRRLRPSNRFPTWPTPVGRSPPRRAAGRGVFIPPESGVSGHGSVPMPTRRFTPRTSPRQRLTVGVLPPRVAALASMRRTGRLLWAFLVFDRTPTVAAPSCRGLARLHERPWARWSEPNHPPPERGTGFSGGEVMGCPLALRPEWKNSEIDPETWVDRPSSPVLRESPPGGDVSNSAR